MRDFIFIIGPSGVGKTTLSKGLFEHYRGAYAEMSMVPEFGVPEGVDAGSFEENVCWECCVAQLKKFHQLGIKNVISGDFELLEKMTKKIGSRPLLVNEFEIDVAGKPPEQVLQEAIVLIDTAETKTEYTYEKPPKEQFYSWVYSNGLR